MLRYISMVRRSEALSDELAALEVDCWKDLARLDPSCPEVLLLAESLLDKGRKPFAAIINCGVLAAVALCNLLRGCFLLLLLLGVLVFVLLDAQPTSVPFKFH